MEKIVVTNGRQILYSDDGNNFPLFLIHGFPEDHTLWDEFKKPLLSHYRVIVPDLPGFGKSALGENEAGIDDMANTIKAIADKEQLTRFAVIGHSMGGYVTLAFAEKYPALLAGFGLFHSISFADDEAKKENRRKTAAFVMKNGSPPLVKELYDGLFSKEFAASNQPFINEMVSYASAFSREGIANASLAMSKRPDRTHVLEKSNLPVLFIIGRHDQLMPVERSMKMVHLPDVASIHILEHTAHMGMFEEKEKAQAAIEDWLKLIVQ